MNTAQELVAGVQDLLTLPEVYLKIQRLLRDPHTGVDDLVRVLHTDPALTARILRIANSAMFNLSRKVETLSLAVNLMGTSRLHDVVLSTSVINSFSRLALRPERVGLFWQRSIHTALLARVLASECRLFDSERLFVAGLLHDIGQLVLEARLPEQVAEADAAAAANAEPVWVVQQRLFGTHYGEVGAALMHAWQFPESLVEVCDRHVAPQDAANFPLECSLVHIARQCVDHAEERDLDLLLDAGIVPAALAIAGLDGVQLARSLQESTRLLAETVDMLVQRHAA